MKRQYRLRRNRDFQRVRRQGKSKASSLMVLAFLQNELDHSRFGFVVSKRLGKAVCRNKIKRQMREATRHLIPQIKPGFDCVFIARQPIGQVPYRAVAESLEILLNQSGLILAEANEHNSLKAVQK